MKTINDLFGSLLKLNGRNDLAFRIIEHRNNVCWCLVLDLLSGGSYYSMIKTDELINDYFVAN